MILILRYSSGLALRYVVSMILFVFFFFEVFSTKNPRVETCATTPLMGTIFCDQNAKISDRVDYIVDKLTVSEKIGILDRYNPFIERFNISYFNFRCESLHGLGHSTCEYGDYHAVQYPNVINNGRSFDMDAISLMTKQVSDSGRALYNVHQFEGVSFYSPVLNIVRDPRWGRLQENVGEDPFMMGEYGKAFINGMLGDGKYAKTIPAAKHYTAYDLENWKGATRHNFDAQVNAQDMKDTINKPFEIAVTQTAVRQIMCSYNSINGVPACANDEYLNKVARDEWKYEGFFLSDLGAVKDMYDKHHYVKSIEDAVATALKGGLDLNDGTQFRDHLQKAIDQGKIGAADLDVHVRRVLARRFEIGEFDSPWSEQEYWKIPVSVVNSQPHKDHALEMARKGMVLLENHNNTLPFDDLSKIKTLGVIGPHIQTTDELCGTYTGPFDSIQPPLEAITEYPKVKEAGIDVLHAKGCEEIACYTQLLFEEARSVAKKSDAVIMFMGLDRKQEREGHDREHLKLPGHQHDLIDTVVNHAKGPVAVVNILAGPVDLTDVRNKAGAILDAGYPCQFGARAIADVLFGAYSPAGRLTVTVYPAKYADQVKMTDMRFRANETDNFPGRTYRFYTGNPVYEFGYGLSYTQFDFKWTSEESSKMDRARIKLDENGGIVGGMKTLSCNVTNVGAVDSDVVVLAFIKNENQNGGGGRLRLGEDAPIKELVGFQRIHLLKAGEMRVVEFDIKSEMFEYTDKTGRTTVLEGKFSFMIEGLRKAVLVSKK